MLTFITGLPGSGKSLHTIWHVQRFRADETAAARKKDAGSPERPVYYFGIADLTLDWTEFDDVTKWPDLPAGSIIVIDEAQRQLPPMAANASRPRHYTEIDTHRHKGYDIFLVTQDAMLVDGRFRSMAERHIHLSRSYGVPAATVYDWKGVQKTTGVAKLNDRDGTVSQWRYPKELFDVYRSAEVHTHRVRLPWKKLGTIAATLALAVGLIGYALSNYRARMGTVAAEVNDAGEAVQVAGLAPAGASSSDLWADVSAFEPRIADLPMSAPAYSGRTKVVDVPRVDGCSLIEWPDRSDCTCNDQRGNRIAVSESSCRAFVNRGGFFDPTVASR